VEQPFALKENWVKGHINIDTASAIDKDCSVDILTVSVICHLSWTMLAA
jgi:hypothetical protein